MKSPDSMPLRLAGTLHLAEADDDDEPEPANEADSRPQQSQQQQKSSQQPMPQLSTAEEIRLEAQRKSQLRKQNANKPEQKGKSQETIFERKEVSNATLKGSLFDCMCSVN